MSQEIDELIIEEPTEETIRELAQTVDEVDGGLTAMHLVAEESTLVEIIVSCADGEILLANPPDNQQETVIRSKKRRTVTPDGGISEVMETSSSSYRASQPSLPAREEYKTTDGWLEATAGRLGIDHETLLDIVGEYRVDTDDQQKRRLLELAFAHHLERERTADCTCVEIKLRDVSAAGRYQYIHNGPDRGGAHYLRDLTPRMKAAIYSAAVREGLTVLSEHESKISVSFEKPAVEDDIRFTKRILRDAFESTFADIVAIDEVIDQDEIHSWLIHT